MLPFVKFMGRNIPMYGLCMALGMITGNALVLIRGRKKGYDVNDLIAALAFAAGGALIGAKALYILSSYGLDRAAASLARGDLSFLTENGLVFYGGLLGGIGGALAGSAFLKKDPEQLCALAVPAVPLGHAIGRLGCLFAGCCYGIPYNGPLAVRTPYAAGTRFPVQPLEAAMDLVLAAVLFRAAERRPGRFYPLYLYLALYAAERFLLEFLRGDQIRGHWGFFSTSQLIGIILLCMSLLQMMRLDRADRREEKQ